MYQISTKGHLLYFILALITCILIWMTCILICSCSDKYEHKLAQDLMDDARIVKYGNCEYLVTGGGDTRAMSHKGDCSNPIHKCPNN